MKRVWRNILRFFRACLTNRLVWVVTAVLLLAWFTYHNIQPVIQHIAVVPADSTTIQIEGRNFGRQQNDSQVILQIQPSHNVAPQVLSWDDETITLVLPEDIQRGQTHAIQVTRQLIRPLHTTWVSFVTQAPDLPTQPYNYDTPVQPDAPWPTFRHDRRNTGRSPLVASYQGDQPWSFQTGKGIFSTPVIDENGIIYVGSADHNFYALNADGSEKWHFVTGELIDSAAAIPRQETAVDPPAILVPSGDGHLYKLNRTDGSLIWSFTAPDEAFNSWFEGNVQIGFDGTIYAGNTNFNYYAINADGTLRWTVPTGANAWSIGALADDGTIYWGSNDTYTYAITPDGQQKWAKMTLGFIAASAAVGSDGTVYIGSFDSYLYALDPATGETKWKFKTGDHIYSSAALAEDENGRTSALYFGSTDGIFYALSPDGDLLWAYDTGDVIRSSPALGQGPDGEIVYFGAGNGRFYALNTADGTRRWSFDTNAESSEQQDRNDLNASPALGETGVYFAGEHGQIWYVPYDYCLHNDNPRCNTTPGSDLPDDVVELYYVTPGGNTQTQFPATLPTATMITLRLLVRENGQTVDAWVCNNPLYCPDDALEITLEPEAPFTWEKSADGHYIYIRPTGFLQPDTAYTLTVNGRTYTGGLALGNLQLGGHKTDTFSSHFTFRTTTPQADPPFAITAESVTAFEWTRLAAPIPPMLPSLNQIGFDYMDWIIAPVLVTDGGVDEQGHFIFWAIGGQRDADGVLVADPESDFMLPFSGMYQGNDLIFQNGTIVMEVTGIPIPFNLLEMRGRLGDDWSMESATLYADTAALSIPTFGPYLVVGGLANDVYKKLLVSGTFVTRPFPSNSPANQRPEGVTVTDITYTPPTSSVAGKVTATLTLPDTLDAAAHRLAILLVDETAAEAVYLNYLEETETAVSANQAIITLTIPEDTPLPDDLLAIVLFDVFPLQQQRLP
ncbi:MAG: PQQ-binding-like beta-propeller repeat protein [Anaerolineales bacterium]|nr:PQQ-binding-like beta-propeller repeat protein [Anaerolineales bacterium]